jgi:hypothetical protein
MNCLLIEMGEMACYQERCPQCGRIPPGRKALPGKKAKPPDVFKKLVSRKLSSKKSVKTNGSVDMETNTRNNQLEFPNSFPLPQNGHRYVPPLEQQLQQHSEQHFTKHDKKYSLKADPVSKRRQLQEDSMV